MNALRRVSAVATALTAFAAATPASNPATQNYAWLDAALLSGPGPALEVAGALQPFGTVRFDADADPGDLCVLVLGTDADVPGLAFPGGDLVPTGAVAFVRVPLNAQGRGSRTFTLDSAPPTSIYAQLVCVDAGGAFSFSNTRGANRGHQWVADSNPVTWSDRAGHSALVHNGKILLLGGLTGQQAVNDVHRYDGSNWVQLLGDAPGTTTRFSGRYEAAIATHGGRVWVGPGAVAGGYVNDLWSSPNGISWTLESADIAADGGPGPRRGARMQSFAGKLFVIGGYYKGSPTQAPTSLYLNEVWAYDEQSQVWSMSHAPWQGREEHSVEVHGGRMYVIGGQSVADNSVPYNFIRFNDVWSTANGVQWKKETSAADFVPMILHSTASFLGELQLFGGYQNSYNYQWRSKGGGHWTVPLELGGPGYNFGNQPIPSAAKDAQPDITRRDAVGLVYAGRLWSIGGYGVSTPYNAVVFSY